jgi:hypothetical protein
MNLAIALPLYCSCSLQCDMRMDSTSEIRERTIKNNLIYFNCNTKNPVIQLILHFFSLNCIEICSGGCMISFFFNLILSNSAESKTSLS